MYSRDWYQACWSFPVVSIGSWLNQQFQGLRHHAPTLKSDEVEPFIPFKLVCVNLPLKKAGFFCRDLSSNKCWTIEQSDRDCSCPLDWLHLKSGWLIARLLSRADSPTISHWRLPPVQPGSQQAGAFISLSHWVSVQENPDSIRPSQNS